MSSSLNFDDLLANKFIPASIIATRQTSPKRRSSQGWQRGAARDLRHNCWLFQTSDPSKRRGDEYIASFDTFVDYPSRSLSDPEFSSDRFSKKLLVLSCLTIGPRDHGNLSGAYVSQIALKFDWILRFRQSLGIPNFASLPPHFAKNLTKTLALGGALSLIPTEDRLHQLAEERLKGKWTLPLRDNGELDWTKLAAVLGTTILSLSKSSFVRLAMIDIFPDMGEPALMALARHRIARSNITPGSPVGDDLDYDLDNEQSTDIRLRNKAKVMSLKSYLEAMELMYRVLSLPESHDPMHLHPFESTSVEALLEAYGSPVERTPTLLPEEMLRVMTEASRWVVTSGDYIADGLDEFKRAHAAGTKARFDALANQCPKGAPLLNLNWAHPTRPVVAGELALDTAVRFLLAACAILIASFAARRSVGVESAHYDCLIQHENGLIEMALYIGKTRQDHVNIPVPEIIRKVVRVLERLSAHIRRATGRQWLFEVAFDDKNPNRLISLAFNTTIREFLDYSIPPPNGQDNWSVAMHQLRRGYGIWYYYGLEGASGEALTLMYAHNDPRMTRIYVTLELPGQINELRRELESKRRVAAENRTVEENDWIEKLQERLSYLNDHAKSFDDVRCEFFVQKMIAIWRGAESVIGQGGKALFADLQGIVEKATATIRIGSAANDPSAIYTLLVDKFGAYASKNFLEPVIGSNIWCRARPGHEPDLAQARCLVLKGLVEKAPWSSTDRPPEDLLPDLDFAGKKICIGCPHCVAFTKGQIELQDEVDADRIYAKLAATDAARKEAELQLDELEQAILRAGPPLSGSAYEY